MVGFSAAAVAAILSTASASLAARQTASTTTAAALSEITDCVVSSSSQYVELVFYSQVTLKLSIATNTLLESAKQAPLSTSSPKHLLVRCLALTQDATIMLPTRKHFFRGIGVRFSHAFCQILPLRRGRGPCHSRQRPGYHRRYPDCGR